MTGTVTHARMWPNGVSIGPVVAEKSERLVELSGGYLWKGRWAGLAKATGQVASEAGYVLGLWLGRPCGLAWLYSTYTVFLHSEKVTEGGMLEGSWSFTGESQSSRNKSDSVRTDSGCTLGRVLLGASGSFWLAWLMWAERACGQWLQGWVVGVWLGWLAGRWCWRESSRNKSDGVAGDQGCAAGGVWFVGCGPGRLGGLCTGKSDQITLHFEDLGVVHANGAVGWTCPAGTMWHTFGWWAVAGLRAVPEKVRIWESSRCHRETRSTLPLSIGAIAIATAQLPLTLHSIY
ncbi:uncharacterized protein MONOS_17061 [Monocercomonoides exilis]|uniref:uncharacterized protein n=1 Tax=Monocercomonoides exilis TaxID=2049356 RepID=UPI0035599ED1|nr:hypothetical protein MONOS_17061 [Monocercomonoides exilis]